MRLIRSHFRSTAQDRKFFGSFFQKRTLALLTYAQQGDRQFFKQSTQDHIWLQKHLAG
jgi:hypothetical protein